MTDVAPEATAPEALAPAADVAAEPTVTEAEAADATAVASADAAAIADASAEPAPAEITETVVPDAVAVPNEPSAPTDEPVVNEDVALQVAPVASHEALAEPVDMTEEVDAADGTIEILPGDWQDGDPEWVHDLAGLHYVHRDSGDNILAVYALADGSFGFERFDGDSVSLVDA